MREKNIGMQININSSNNENSNIIGFQNNEALNITVGKPKNILTEMFSKCGKWIAGFFIKK